MRFFCSVKSTVCLSSICDCILHSIAFEQFGKAEALLEAYRAAYCGGTEGRSADSINTPAADRLERQFYLGMLAQIRRCAGESGQRLHALFHEALTLTMPTYDQKPLTEMTLSLKELNLMLEAERYRRGGSRPRRCQEIVAYIETRSLDRRGRAKIYPKAVYYLYLSLTIRVQGPEEDPEIPSCPAGDQEEDPESPHCPADHPNHQTAVGLFRQCNTALNILRDNGRMYFLWEILSVREELLDRLPEDLFRGGNPDALQTMRRETRE